MKSPKVKPIPPQSAASVKLPISASLADSSGSAVPSKRSVGTLPSKLRLVAPAARQVYVAGSFNNWHAAALPLQPAGGEWVGEVKLAPGRYEYLFVVDGKWLPDPGATEKVPNPFGGFNSLLSVS
jgi:1,4-alpha-glucan branching enzyme